MPFRSGFFAFPNDPPELRAPILAATELIKSNDRVKSPRGPNRPSLAR